MSRLASLQADLNEASSAITRAERTLAKHPNVRAVEATLHTIIKRRESLEEQFSEEAERLGLNACSYRVEYDEQHVATIQGITSALSWFQKTFTSVYDAIVNGPKQRAKASAETIAATSFGFAYSFPGSVGIMMTLANQELLVDKSNLDEAMGLTFELLRCQSVVEVEAITEKVGLPAVRLAHWWASENAKAGFGADIHWIRKSAPDLELRVQPQEVANLSYQIALSAAKEKVVRTGVLTSVNTVNKTFEMEIDKKVISGTFDKAINETQPAQLPRLYKATLEVSTKVAADAENEQPSYYLIKLENPGILSADEMGL